MGAAMHDLRPYFLRPASRVLLIASGAVLAACVPGDPANEAGNETEEPALNLPAVPMPPPPLDRARLLAAVAEAASASASGLDDRQAQRAFDGRQFELRIRFGCRGPREDLQNYSLSWSHDPQSGTLRVRALPTISAEDPIIAELGGDAFEAVEGFWIPRPWLLEPVCPRAAALIQPAASPADTEAAAGTDPPADEQSAGPEQQSADPAAVARPAPIGPKIGIAQFFTPTDPRTQRRDNRAYQSVTNVSPGQPLRSQGFNLVLSGRLRALPGRSVINCTAHGPGAPPDCVVSADFDRVWIERPDTKEILAEWGSG